MFYVLAAAVVMVLDLCFLGDVQMNEVRIVRFLGGKVGILGEESWLSDPAKIWELSNHHFRMRDIPMVLNSRCLQ